MNAQRFRVGSVGSLKSTAFDSKSEILYTIFQDSIVAYSGFQFNQRNAYPIENTFPGFADAYRPVIADNLLYFVEDNGGIVYQFTGDSLKRIDRSFSHRMQGASSMMVRNDTIFRYGGYGFWSNRNLITFFSESSREWEIVIPHGKQEVPEGVNSAGMTNEANNTYLYGGYYRLPYELNDRTFYDKAWRFNWPEHKWEQLGSLNQNFVLAKSHIDMGNRDLYYLSRRLLVVVDPSQNKVNHFALPDSRFENDCADGKCHVSNNLNARIDGFYQDGNFYLPFFYPNTPELPNSTGTLIYQIIPESEFLLTLVGEEPLYFSDDFPWKKGGFLLVALSLLGGFIFVLRKKNSKIKFGYKTTGWFLGDSRCLWTLPP